MKAKELLFGIACIIIWGLVFAILVTTPIVMQDSDGKCIEVVPSSAGNCDALPKRYEIFVVGVKKQ